MEVFDRTEHGRRKLIGGVSSGPINQATPHSLRRDDMMKTRGDKLINLFPLSQDLGYRLSVPGCTEKRIGGRVDRIQDAEKQLKKDRSHGNALLPFSQGAPPRTGARLILTLVTKAKGSVFPCNVLVVQRGRGSAQPTIRDPDG